MTGRPDGCVRGGCETRARVVHDLRLLRMFAVSAVFTAAFIPDSEGSEASPRGVLIASLEANHELKIFLARLEP